MSCEDLKVRLDMRSLHLAGFTGLRVDGVLVPIVTTPCNFGGERRWFLCPRCDRRCQVIYEGLQCRKCTGARYELERLCPRDRAILQAIRLRRKLGQNGGNMSMPIPERPEWMRGAAYAKIRARIQKLELDAILITHPQFLRRDPPMQ